LSDWALQLTILHAAIVSAPNSSVEATMVAEHKKTEGKSKQKSQKKAHVGKHERGKSATANDARPAEVDEPWDEVAEASWESFPASDPPPWTVSRPGKPKAP
jgi:hypothetical protein